MQKLLVTRDSLRSGKSKLHTTHRDRLTLHENKATDQSSHDKEIQLNIQPLLKLVNVEPLKYVYDAIKCKYNPGKNKLA